MKVRDYSFLLAFVWAGCASSPEWTFQKEIPLQDITPVGIFCENGSLWLSDVKNNRVVKLDTNGNILKEYTGFQRPMHISAENAIIYVPEYLSDTIKMIDDDKVGIMNLLEKPDAPASVEVKGKSIAVADFYNHRIILQEKESLIIIGKEGHGQGELNYPTDVAIENELVYVADAYNNRIQVFDKRGNSLKIIGEQEKMKVTSGLTIANDRIITTDFENNRVLVYSLEGDLVQILSDHLQQPIDISISGNQMFVANYKSESVTIFEND